MSETWRIFFALGDPHRLTMIERLAHRGPQAMVRLIEGLPFTRQAGAKHIDVLAQAGLVRVERSGRERVVSLDRENMHLARMFMVRMESDWDDRLDALRAITEG